VQSSVPATRDAGGIHPKHDPKPLRRHLPKTPNGLGHDTLTPIGTFPDEEVTNWWIRRHWRTRSGGSARKG